MTMAARLPLRHPSPRRGRKVAQSCEKWRGATGDVSGRKHWARVKPEMPLSREKEPSWPAGKAYAWRGKQPNLVPHEPRAGGGAREGQSYTTSASKEGDSLCTLSTRPDKPGGARVRLAGCRHGCCPQSRGVLAPGSTWALDCRELPVQGHTAVCRAVTLGRLGEAWGAYRASRVV